MVAKFQLPRDDQRVVIVGSTGGGKTQAGIWQLSERSFTEIPWYILDYKRDALIGKLPAKEVSLTDEISDNPGVFVVRPLPGDKAEVEEFLWKLWTHGRVGLYVDEGYMVGDSPAFEAILTQGRSKNIPVIVLSQRPVWITRFAFSEASHYQIFWLHDVRDRKTMQPFLSFDLEKRLDPYHSVWYDIGADATFVLKPVPSEAKILARFRQRLSTVVSAETAQNKARRFRTI